MWVGASSVSSVDMMAMNPSSAIGFVVQALASDLMTSARSEAARQCMVGKSRARTRTCLAPSAFLRTVTQLQRELQCQLAVVHVRGLEQRLDQCGKLGSIKVHRLWPQARHTFALVV